MQKYFSLLTLCVNFQLNFLSRWLNDPLMKFIYRTCSKKNNGSFLITEVLLSRLNIRMGNHPCVPVLYAKSVWRCILHLRLPPLRSHVGSVYVDLNLTWVFFSGYPGFPAPPKIDFQSKTPGVLVLCSMIIHDPLMTAWGAFHFHSAAPFELRPSQFSLNGCK